MWYFLNGLSILDVKFANLAPLGATYMDGMTGEWKYGKEITGHKCVYMKIQNSL